MIFKLAARSLINNRRFTLFFVLNLCLGLTGFVALEMFKTSIDKSLTKQSKSILTADIAVSCRRPFTEEELSAVRKTIGPDIPETSSTEMFAMVSFNGLSRLVELKTIASNYPFYGEILLENQGIATPAMNKLILEKEKKLWVYPEILIQLGAKIGDQLEVGTQKFIIDDVVKNDAASSIRGSSIAARIYMSESNLPFTGLLDRGATVSYTYFYKLPESTDLEKLEKNLFNQLVDPAVRVITHKSASESAGQILKYLNDYLGLVSIVALFLSSVGTAYLFRMWLARHYREMAILISLGMIHKNVLKLFLTQLVFLGLAASMPTTFLSLALVPLIREMVSGLSQFKLELSLNYSTIIVAFLIAIIGNLFICAPLLFKILNLKPKDIFSESLPSMSEGGKSLWPYYIPAIVFYWLLAMWLSKSYYIGSIFTLTLMGSSIVLLFIGFLLLKFIKNLKTKALASKLVFRNLSRRPLGTLTSFVAISLGSLLLNLIPQIQNDLQTEVSNPEGSKVPSLFLFDIQPEQLEPVEKFLAEMNYKLQFVSPMIRSRLEKVNGEAFEKKSVGKAMTREEEREYRFRNRGFNLSYRLGLSDSEKIVEGQDFTGNYDFNSNKIPEISVEQKFAERLGFKIGDKLLFDVQGVPIEGQIVNFRKVLWTSFQPNFFVQFQPGVLDEAPKIFLASIMNLDEIEKNQLQSKLVQKFPNVSMLDISRTVVKILEIASQFSWALIFMAVLCVFTGFVVLFAIVSFEIFQRKYEIELLKVLGGSQKMVSGLMISEFLMLGGAAAIMGTLLSQVASFAISYFIFSRTSLPNWWLSFALVIIITTLTGLVSYFASRRFLLAKPQLRVLD